MILPLAIAIIIAAAAGYGLLLRAGINQIRPEPAPVESTTPAAGETSATESGQTETGTNDDGSS